MDRVAALPTGTKLVLGAGALLFIDLFLTWQTLELDFGDGTTVTRALDGWDFWGLLVGLLTLVLLAVVIVRETETELLLEARWDIVPLALASLALALTVVKNLRDAESSWASYAGIALAGLMVAGTLIEWLRNRSDEAGVVWQPRPAGPSEASPIGTDRSSDETRARW